ncbi:hypothetical protein E2562_014509 [Oryza meyeriana var. granulata]|uniref:Disease resistance N-terminal domain-containing protein n=1 Tax=Oryza meyeriana var. granulata TaxID=110450 RepID=A0A6G1EJW3_9ORYZ|nr:hypothetical protein E2562_014509 [Oryza meyeriana var. granulata]
MAETVLVLVIKKIGIALANEVTNQASAQFAKHAVQLTELQGSMGRIMRELRVMHDFLCQMDNLSRGNQVYQGWLEEVRKVVYLMEDMVDEYLHLVGHQRDDSLHGESNRERPGSSVSDKGKMGSHYKQRQFELQHCAGTPRSGEHFTLP